MKHPYVATLTSKFRNAGAPLAPKKTRKKRPSPISFRVTDDERVQLQDMAGRTPIGTYVKACLFEGKKPRKSRQANVVKDYEALAQVLGTLGRSDVFRNLNTLIIQAEAGNLNLSDEHVRTVLAACACISSMRADLIRALGLKAD
ncbi:hypothetical protein [uncultured Tateyamaria sp.]|uniref:hypothetical protein n=1 Tax=uncultured Tateyamaria sp. TaxID=455651 RepID=UPI0026391E3D|nr:hypothetical protein [uncultured Tateyamaria sp.]